MKIGLFTDTYYPQINGVVTSVRILKENLELLGHEVYLFTTTHPSALKDEKNVFRLPSMPIATVWRVGMFYSVRFAKFIKELQLDVIHTHTEFSLGLFGRAIARELQIPLVHTYHTIFEHYAHYFVKFAAFEPLAKKAVRKFSAKLCNTVDQVIVPMDKVRNLLLTYDVKQPISTIPTGVDLARFSSQNYSNETIQKLREFLGIQKKDKVLLFVGRLAKEKNIEKLLLDLQTYLLKVKDVKLVLIGDGPERPSLENMTKALGIDRQTVFAGEKPWNQIGMYYQCGDVFISASQSETQGLTYIEALASGLPIVATKDKCLEGILLNDKNGYTYNKKGDLHHALNSILNNEYQKHRLTLGAVQSVEKYSANHFAKSIEQLYKKVIDRQKGKQKVS